MKLFIVISATSTNFTTNDSPMKQNALQKNLYGYSENIFPPMSQQMAGVKAQSGNSMDIQFEIDLLSNRKIF